MPSLVKTDTLNLPLVSSKAFLNAESTLSALENTIPQLVFFTTTDGIITYANNSFNRLIGCNRDEVYGRSLHGFIDFYELTADNQKNVSKYYLFKKITSKINKEGDNELKEISFLSSEKHSIRFITSITGIFSENNLIGFLFIATNIEEQKKVENAWRESENKFRLLAENIPGTIYLCKNDAFFTPIYLNDHIETLTGYTASEFISGTINFVQLYHPEDVKTIFDTVEGALEEKKSFSLQYRLRHKSDIYKWVSEVGIGLYANDQLIMLEGYMNDITDCKNAEDEIRLSRRNLEMAANSLQKQNNQLNNFAHILSHNLRSPVGNISALISLLNEKSTIEEYKTIFENLKHTSTSLQETLNDLMETLRIKEDVDIARERLSFAECLKKNQQDLAGEILKVNAKIYSDFSMCPEIIYPKAYLESIFLNLLSNSLKYFSDKRSPIIKFKSFRENGKIHLTITDNGKGIDLSRHGEDVFGLRKTFHDHPDAKGVGLFLTKTQIETLGGSISVESEFGKSTTFTIQF